MVVKNNRQKNYTKIAFVQEKKTVSGVSNCDTIKVYYL